MKELSTALDASLQPIAAAAAAGKRLPAVRDALAGYVTAAHHPYGTLGMSPYAVAGELGPLLQAPRLRLNAGIGSVTVEELLAAQRALADLVVHANAIGDPAAHPWRETGKTFYTEDDRRRWSCRT
ncbi:MAG: hypothetical protein H0W08_07815 [Acidobacteria bacterium]|nr:hypothetical protein [Acidobacteriota bacterium]